MSPCRSCTQDTPRPIVASVGMDAREKMIEGMTWRKTFHIRIPYTKMTRIPCGDQYPVCKEEWTLTLYLCKTQPCDGQGGKSLEVSVSFI